MKLVNISNHPISKWGEAQKHAAYCLWTKSLGDSVHELMDIPHPNISPSISSTCVRKIAQEIADNLPPDTGAIHLMGETTLVSHLLDILKGEYPIYCSTTERNVVEREDGVKETRFEFVQFRLLNLFNFRKEVK